MKRLVMNRKQLVMKEWLICTGLCCAACGTEPAAQLFPPAPVAQRVGSPAGAAMLSPPTAALPTESAADAPVPATMPAGAAGPASAAEGSPADAPVPVLVRAGPALLDAPDAAPVSDPAPSEGEPNASLDNADAGPPLENADPVPAVSAPVADSPVSSTTPSEEAAAGDLPTSAATVTVSFTFDDTYAPQVQAAAILEAYGLRGTFYVNSPQLHQATAEPDSASAMSIAQVLDLQARGHDIGGHTLGHLSLTDIPEQERIREIMGDRAQLMRLGIAAQSFAYPYGHVEDDPDRSLGRPVLEITRGSGYSSGRDTNGFDLENCTPGPETLPPEDAFILRSVRSVNEPPDGADRLDPPDTAATLLGWMDRAALCGGGWLPLVFHHLRDDCSAADAPDGYCFDFAELDRLAKQVATGKHCPNGGSNGCYRIQVATVSAAIGPTSLAPAAEVPGLRNPSLERTLDSGETECFDLSGDSQTVAFSRSGPAHTGQASQRLEIGDPYLGPAEIRVSRDYGECSIFSTEGGSYQLSLYYRAEPQANLPRLRFVTYRLTSDYQWVAWETGTAFSARTPGSWVPLSFTTSAVPPETIAISFGLRQESTGVINVDDFDSLPVGG